MAPGREVDRSHIAPQHHQVGFGCSITSVAHLFLGSDPPGRTRVGGFELGNRLSRTRTDPLVHLLSAVAWLHPRRRWTQLPPARQILSNRERPAIRGYVRGLNAAVVDLRGIQSSA